MLASIVIVALKGMLMQIGEFPRFMRKSKKDGFVWMVTFLVVVIVSIDIGLLVGIILSLCCILCNSLQSDICYLGNIPDTDLYLDVEKFEKAVELPFVKIFHYSGSINFATKASFRNRLCETLGINLLKELKYSDKDRNLNFKQLILDFSSLSSIDPSSVTMLTALINDFIKLNINICITGCSSTIYEILQRNEFKYMNLLYPTIPDAIHMY